jgi:hypothetical protein
VTKIISILKSKVEPIIIVKRKETNFSKDADELQRNIVSTETIKQTLTEVSIEEQEKTQVNNSISKRNTHQRTREAIYSSCSIPKKLNNPGIIYKRNNIYRRFYSQS